MVKKDNNKFLTKEEYDHVFDFEEACFEKALSQFEAQKHHNDFHRRLSAESYHSQWARHYREARLRQLAKERRPPAENAFDLVDANRSNKVTWSEFVKEFKRIDENSSTIITQKEFVNWFFARLTTVCDEYKSGIRQTIAKMVRDEQEKRDQEAARIQALKDEAERRKAREIEAALAREAEREKIEQEERFGNIEEETGSGEVRKSDDSEPSRRQQRVRISTVDGAPVLKMPATLKKSACTNWESVVGKRMRIDRQRETVKNFEKTNFDEVLSLSQECIDNYGSIQQALLYRTDTIFSKRDQVEALLDEMLVYLQEKSISLVRQADMNSIHTNSQFFEWAKTASNSDLTIRLPPFFEKLFNDQCSGPEVTSYELLFKLSELWKYRAWKGLEQKEQEITIEPITVSAECPSETQGTLRRMVSIIDHNNREEALLQGIEPFLDRLLVWLKDTYGN